MYANQTTKGRYAMLAYFAKLIARHREDASNYAELSRYCRDIGAMVVAAHYQRLSAENYRNATMLFDEMAESSASRATNA